MDGLLRYGGGADSFSASPLGTLRDATRRLRPKEPYVIMWWIFTASVALSMLPEYFGEPPEVLHYFLAYAGAAGCGWAWLMTRSLFRAENPIRPWTLYVVAGIIAVEGTWHLASEAGAASGEFGRVVTNAASLICITALSLVLVEAISGYGDKQSHNEKRFRQIFIGVFCSIVVITLVWALGASDAVISAEWVEMIVATCALIGVLGSRLAVNYRKNNPLAPPAKRKSPPSAAALDQQLAQRIVAAIEEGERFTTPDLKVADLADALGEQEYKVTQCITGALGYRNFNQFVNERRIALAQAVLADPKNAERPILAIAFDCGFSSIGPFNRAFKQTVGMTPRAFRMKTLGQTVEAVAAE